MPVVTSGLTLLEVSIRPLRDKDDFLIAPYRKVLLDTKGLASFKIGEEVLSLAAQIRANNRLKTPDAIHAATAILAGATMFLTNDFGFRRVSGLNVFLLDEVVLDDVADK